MSNDNRDYLNLRSRPAFEDLKLAELQATPVIGSTYEAEVTQPFVIKVTLFTEHNQAVACMVTGQARATMAINSPGEWELEHMVMPARLPNGIPPIRIVAKPDNLLDETTGEEMQAIPLSQTLKMQLTRDLSWRELISAKLPPLTAEDIQSALQRPSSSMQQAQQAAETSNAPSSETTPEAAKAEAADSSVSEQRAPETDIVDSPSSTAVDQHSDAEQDGDADALLNDWESDDEDDEKSNGDAAPAETVTPQPTEATADQSAEPAQLDADVSELVDFTEELDELAENMGDDDTIVESASQMQTQVTAAERISQFMAAQHPTERNNEPDVAPEPTPQSIPQLESDLETETVEPSAESMPVETVFENQLSTEKAELTPRDIRLPNNDGLDVGLRSAVFHGSAAKVKPEDSAGQANQTIFDLYTTGKGMIVIHEDRRRIHRFEPHESDKVIDVMGHCADAKAAYESAGIDCVIWYD